MSIFSVDGTLVEAWTSHKSFQSKDEPKQPPDAGNPSVNFRDEERWNGTRQCADQKPDGLVVDMELLSFSGTAEREGAFLMVERM